MESLVSLNHIEGSTSELPAISQEPQSRDQWVQLLPKGPTIPTKDGRGPYTMEDAEAVIAASFMSSGGEMLPVDYNHAIDLAESKGAKTPAAGWIKQMEVRTDGIWGLIEWTPRAFTEIRNRDFRFISPALAHTPDFQIKGILRASLTNVPALTMVSLNSLQKGKPMDDTEFFANLRSKLDLEENASSQNILATVDKLLTSTNSVDPSKFVPIDVFQNTVAELQKLDQGISLQSAEHIVERAIEDRQLLPFMRDWAVSLCSTNRPAFDEFLNGAGKPVKKFIDDLHAPQIDVSKMHKLDQAKGKPVQDEISKTLGLTSDDLEKYGDKETSR